MQLYYRLNYRVITLGAEGDGETVTIHTRTGVTRRPWLGFISPWVAKRLPGAIPVRLAVVAYTTREFQPWQNLTPGDYVLGCLIDSGAFGIVEDGHPRIVKPLKA